MTRILQLSDLHIVGEGELAYGVVDTAKCLQNAVDYINKIKPNIGHIDGILITGDISETGLPQEYRRYQNLIAPLDLPVIMLPGNHDERRAMAAAFPDQNWHDAGNPLNSHQKLGNIDVLALDCTVPNQQYGELSNQTADWLKDKLKSLDGLPVITGLHHPPFKCGIEHMDAQPFREPEKLLSILEQHKGPKLVLCGHVHRYMTCFHKNIPMSIAPSVAHAVNLDMSPNALAEFALEPGGLLIHEFDGDFGRFTSHFIPIGPHDGPFPFF